MTPERLAEVLEVLADGPPWDTAWLRSLLPELAVRGRLVAQEAGDESVDIAVDRARVELEGHKPPKGRAATGTFQAGDAALCVGRPDDWPLPVGWMWMPLGSVARLETGHTPDRKVPEYWGGDLPWIGIGDARKNHGGVIYETESTITDAGEANSAARRLPVGTVCLSRTASLGYTVIMGDVMCTSQDFVDWVPSSALLGRYLQTVLLAEQRGLRRFAKGAVHLTIYFPEVKAFHIALPPLAEQHRIVAKVDELLALCDTLETSLARAKTTREQFAASISHALAGGLAEGV